MSAMLALALTAVLASAGPAVADPAPFGRACVPAGDHRVCAGGTLADRVPSWDGTPIDVDVRIPPTGDGPWPTVVWLHGFGGDKLGLAEQTTAYAAAGYAAVAVSSRGFGRSCGSAESRTPDCARGWLHVADQRYEVRDIQHLLGVLADQRVTIPDRVGATGSSYGGIQALQLAFLKDRIRLPGGGYAPWRSPAGTPMRVAGAAPMLAWSDAVAAMFPGGDFGDATTPASTATRTQFGPRLASFFDLITTGAQVVNFVAPPGADPSVDFRRWLTLSGEALTRPDGKRALDELYRYRSALAIEGGTPAPLILAQGWTDSATPVSHALAVYRTLRARDRRAQVWMTLSDFGHWRSMNKRRTTDLVNARNLRFFDHFLRGGPAVAPAGAVRVYRSDCTNARSDGPPIDAGSYEALARGRVTATRDGLLGTVTSSGGLRSIARGVDPVRSREHCTTVPLRSEPGTATLGLRVQRAFTYLGRAVVRARIRGTGGPRGELVARLWEVDGSRQRLVDRSVHRVDLPRTGEVRLELNGAARRFARGTHLRLQLLGRDDPTYEAPDRPFRIAVSDVTVDLPARERDPGRALAVRPRG